MKALVVKQHSNYYYVKSDQDNVLYECMIRERLKKENISIVTGDYVELDEINSITKQAVITGQHTRISFIGRPAIANIDQNIIVMSINQPLIDFAHLDRFITHSQLSNLNFMICINKIDLKDKNNNLDKVEQIYGKLGCDLIYISAKENIGLENLKDKLKNKKTVLSGPSGVGKSSIINSLFPQLNIKVGFIGSKSNKGTHTTRHTELIALPLDDNYETMIADTPGFSYLKFDNYLPETIEKSFDDFKPYRAKCFYSDCLHINENDCFIRNNLNLIEASRYENYIKFVTEAMVYKEKLYSTSSKDEGNVKTINSSDNKNIKRLKLGYNLVKESRKKSKQILNSIELSLDFEDNLNDNQ